MSFADIIDFNEGKMAIQDDYYYKKVETEICFLPDCIVGTGYSCTAVIIYCSEDVQDAVADRFPQIFEECYKNAMVAAAKDFYGEDLDITEEEVFFDESEEEDMKAVICEEQFYGIPLSDISKTEGGIIIQLGRLDLHEPNGHHMFMDAEGALEKALNSLNEEFPSITYEGHVAYIMSDVSCGEIRQYVFSSDKKHPDYPYRATGESLAIVLQDEEFWDKLSHCAYKEEEFIELLECFRLYAEWLPSDALNRLLETASAFEKEEGKMKEFRLLVLEYKNTYFPDFDPLEKFTLEW